MLIFIGRRVLEAIPTMLGVLLVVFSLLYLLPGDPIMVLLSTSEATGITEAEISAMREKYGLNDPLPLQFAKYVGNLMRGELGDSVMKARPVTTLIKDAFPKSMQLAAISAVIAIVFGLFLGIVAAVKRGTFIDTGSMTASLFFLSVPEFWLSILLILLVSVKLNWLPAAGSSSIKHLILPSIVLGSRAAASIARLTRSAMLDVLQKQYITSAWAKGLGPGAVVMKHALRNAMIPVVTLLGLQLGRLLSGTVVVEIIFARQGLGKILIDGILAKDIPVVRGTILVVALGYVLVNLAVDISYGMIDPRISYS